MADDIDTEIAEIEDSMSDDFAGYQGDTAKQERYGALLAAQEAGTAAPAKPSADAVRKGELEALMKDDRSVYWTGSQSDRLQNEYRGLLEAEDKPASPARDEATGRYVAVTEPAVADALTAIEASGDVGREWAAELGGGAKASKALEVGEDQRLELLAAMGDSAGDVQQSFEGLDNNVQMAIYRELSNTYSEPQPPATADQMATFMETEHGALVAADWGSKTSRRLATALHRWERMTVLLTDAEDAALHGYFWRMTAQERAAILMQLGK